MEGSGPPREPKVLPKVPKLPPNVTPKLSVPDVPRDTGMEDGGGEEAPTASGRATDSSRVVVGGRWASPGWVVGGEVGGKVRMGSGRDVSGGGDGATKGARGI